MTKNTPMTAACLDLTGSNRAWDLTHVSEDDHVVKHFQFGGETKIGDFLHWVREVRPTAIALDAPSGKHLARTAEKVLRTERGWRENKYLNMRLCEAELVSRNVNLYYTPADPASAEPWIRTGWEVYHLLEQEFGYLRISSPGTVQLSDQPTLIEVHPFASFVVGLGWKPQKKVTLAGQLERSSYLAASTHWGQVPLTGEPLPRPDLIAHLSGQLGRTSWDQIRSNGIELDSLPHDVLDSIVGLVTVIRAYEGVAFAVGDPDEGLIVLPGLPKDRYSIPERKAKETDARL